ncbi:MAG: hypothetical protein ABWY25_07670 [Paenisporosarcina sp.]
MAELLKLNLVLSKFVRKGDILTVTAHGREWSTICDKDGTIETVYIHDNLMFPNYANHQI